MATRWSLVVDFGFDVLARAIPPTVNWIRAAMVDARAIGAVWAATVDTLATAWFIQGFNEICETIGIHDRLPRNERNRRVNSGGKLYESRFSAGDLESLGFGR